MAVKIGILTASDRAAQGVYEDESGKAIEATMADYLTMPFEVFYRLVPDEQSAIPYCIDLIGGPSLESDPSVLEVFRPKQDR